MLSARIKGKRKGSKRFVLTAPEFKSWFLILLFLNFSSCADVKTAPSIFTEVPAGKTTNSASRFELIDDFNAGVGKTKFGSEWKTSETNGTKLRLFHDREDAVRYGGSMGIEYTLPARQIARVFVPLNGVDVSQAGFLVFLIRKSDARFFDGKIAVGLRDMSGKDMTVEIRTSKARVWKGPKSEWLEIAVPRSAFKALDFNRLDRFELMLMAPAREIKGFLTVDEVAFFGLPDLVFQSDRDNLAGFLTQTVNERRRNELLSIRDDKEFLREVARDSWLYFEQAIDRETALTVDHVRTGVTSGIGSYVSPTNAALYWLANVAAFDLSLISKDEAIRNIQASLATFEKLDRWGSGFWYNYYHTRNLRVTRNYVSVVDNGWLAAGLIVIRQAFPEHFKEKADEILKRLDFSVFYDASNGQLKLGFEADKDVFSRYHYGLLATEARLASYIAIGKGDLDKEHWARIYRTLPVEWDWQKQIPEGSEQTLFGVPVFEGFYTYLNKKFVPSWGGSLFEFLSPTLVVKEQELAPEGLGKNNLAVTDLHIDYALREKAYPVWGMAPCAIQNGKYWIYREYGVSQLGAKGYPDRGVVTPYASFLALATRPEAAVRNLREMLKRYPDVYGEYGFYDSVDTVRGKVNYQYLALDQGMSFLAIANYVKDGVIRERFHADPIGKNIEALLLEEKFAI